MSAIGSYVCMRPADLERCLDLAREVTASPPSRWPWQAKAETPRERFAREWQKAIIQEVVFDGAGELLSSYFLAQDAVNGFPDPFEQPEAAIFAKVFPAAFAVREALILPEMERGALQQFCEAEWDTNAGEMCAGSAHRFLKEGLARAAENTSVVFVIS